MALKKPSRIPVLSRIESFISTAPRSRSGSPRSILVLPAPLAASITKLDGRPARSITGQGRASGEVHRASADGTSRKPTLFSKTGRSTGSTYLQLLPATNDAGQTTPEEHPHPARPPTQVGCIAQPIPESEAWFDITPVQIATNMAGRSRPRQIW